MITILCVGKKHEQLFAAAIAHYEQRLAPFSRIKWQILAPSGFDGQRARDDESNRIVARLSPDDVVILLDEKGRDFTSQDLATYIERARTSSRTIVCIIGGAYGVNDAVRQRANHCLAFGSSVFPHQLVRVMLLEQLYRAHSLLAGSKYHHE